MVKNNNADNSINPEQKTLNKLDLCGLPNYNITRLWDAHLESPFIYPEIIFQSSLMSICRVTMKRIEAITEDIFGNEFEDPLYTNLYSLGLFPTASGKTTVKKTTAKVVTKVIGKENTVPNAPTPETLQKHLASSVVESRLNRETGKISIREYGYENPTYPKDWGFMDDEEIGGLFTKAKKPTMAGTLELLCSLYSCEMPPKKNSGESQGSTVEYKTEDPFLAICGYTVPQKMTVLDSDTIDSGFVPRNIITMATYEIPLPPTDYDDDEEEDMLSFDDTENQIDMEKAIRVKGLENAFRIIDNLLAVKKFSGEKLRARFHKKSLRLIKNWEIEMRNHFRGNPHIKDMRSRHMENAYKIAILLELGNLPYYVVSQDIDGDEIRINGKYSDIADVSGLLTKLAVFDISKLDSYKLNTLVVTPETMEFTLKMFDRLYLPHALQAVRFTLAGDDADTERVYDLLKNYDKVSKEEVLANSEDIKKFMTDFFVYKSEIRSDEDYLKNATEKANDVIEYIKSLPDDVVVNTVTRTKLLKDFRSSAERLDPVLNTLIHCGVVVACIIRTKGSKRPTTVYMYIQDGNHGFSLPEVNYEDYTGTSIYSSGVILEKLQEINTDSSSVSADNTTTEYNLSETIA